MNWRRRIFDLCGAAGGLLFFSPVMAAAALAILLEDGGPVLFRQTRLGRGRRPFEILKFRSMRDGRVTRIGRLLRATGLDELPQFVNILRGELSAVGPRPITADDAARFGWMGADAAGRWSVNPGLTGLAQLAGRSIDESLALDLAYVRDRTLALDCRMIAMSFVVNALGKSRARRLFFRPSKRSVAGLAPGQCPASRARPRPRGRCPQTSSSRRAVVRLIGESCGRRGASAYARKTAPPARASRCPRRLG